MAELGTVYVDIEGQWDDFSKKTESGFAGVAKKAAVAFAGAFVVSKAIDFGKASVDAASDLNESANAVAKSFDAINGEKIEALGKTAAESYGLSASAFNSFAVQFSGFAGQIAGEGGDVAGTVDALTTRIADFASVQNLEVGDAAQKFQAALAGETEAMRRYGIDVSAAAVEQFAMANGIGDGTGALTEQEKVLARSGLLMQKTEQWAGDFADTSDELANSQRIAKASFQDVQAELGGALLPILGEVMGVVREQLIPVIGQLAPVFGLVAQAIAAILPSVADLLGLLIPLLVDLLTPLIPVITQVAEVIVALATPILKLIGTALKPLIAMVARVAGDLLEALAPALDEIAGLFVAWGPILELVLVLLEPFLPIIELLAKLLGAVLGVAVQLLTKYLTKLGTDLRPVIDVVRKFAEILEGGLAKLLPSLLEWFRVLPEKVVSFVKNAGTWLVETGKNLVRGFLDGIRSMASKIIDTIKRTITDAIPDFVQDALGISSPSLVMAGLGREVSLGLAQGIVDETRAVDKAVAGLVTTPTFGLNAYGSAAAGGMAGPLSMTFNGPVGGDLGVFSQQVMDAAAREQRYANG